MGKPDKIFRDPLYDYISIDRDHDGWLLELLDCAEVQRLRRIHQLGVSHLTYPGADHNRLAHSLGVVHLMQAALGHLSKIQPTTQALAARDRLLAAAMLHDVGHGPFSHLFEPCLGIDHEAWSGKIVLDSESQVNRVLRKRDSYLPQMVADLIEKDNRAAMNWQKALLSSQLDMDRLDYLRRDSLFTGAGYGRFDVFRILNTFELHDGPSGQDLVWAEKSKLAIEEYVFARYYMYQNVYFHKTTRGFEKMVEAMWRRAKQLAADGVDVGYVSVLKGFLSTEEKDRSIGQYLGIEEFTVLQQIQQWQAHDDQPLRTLARCFLERRRFSHIAPPPPDDELEPQYDRWEDALHALARKQGFDPPEFYCLRDRVKGKYHQPYFPEKDSEEQSAKNAIRVKLASIPEPVEISTLLPRLQPVTQKLVDQVNYYVPQELRDAALRLRAEWK